MGYRLGQTTVWAEFLTLHSVSAPSTWRGATFGLSLDARFLFSASIQASIRFRMPPSVHSLRSRSSRSISALICAISPGESMAQVYATAQKCSILLRQNIQGKDKARPQL